jgi:hypothetical protein
MRAIWRCTPVIAIDKLSDHNDKASENKRKKSNSILNSKLVQSIRNDHANLTKIKEFEIEDMKNQI